MLTSSWILCRVVILPIDIAIDYGFKPTEEGIKNQHDEHGEEQRNQGVIAVYPGPGGQENDHAGIHRQ